MKIHFCLWGRQENALVSFEFWRQTTWTHSHPYSFVSSSVSLLCVALTNTWGAELKKRRKCFDSPFPGTADDSTALGPCGRAEQSTHHGREHMSSKVAHSSCQEGGQSGWKGLGTGGGGGGMGWRGLWVRGKREKDTVCSFFKGVSPVALLPLTLKISQAGWEPSLSHRSFREIFQIQTVTLCDFWSIMQCLCRSAPSSLKWLVAHSILFHKIFYEDWILRCPQGKGHDIIPTIIIICVYIGPRQKKV